MYWKQRLYDAYVSNGQSGIKQEHKISTDFPYGRYLLKKFFPKSKEIIIADLGCGYGKYLHFFKQEGYIYVKGVDISEEQVEIAHANGLDEISQGTIADFLTTNGDNSFDIVLLMDILEHLEKQELFDMLDLVYKSLKPNGKVIIHTPNAEGLFGLRIRYGDLTHETSFTAQAMRQLLGTIGFANVISYEDKPIPHSFFSVMRRIIWSFGTIPFRILLSSETGTSGFILSQNFLTVATKTK